MTTSRQLCPACGTKTKKTAPLATDAPTPTAGQAPPAPVPTSKPAPLSKTCTVTPQDHRPRPPWRHPWAPPAKSSTTGSQQCDSSMFPPPQIATAPTTRSSSTRPYLAGGCLLIASTRTHVLAWHWARRENNSRRHRPTPTPCPTTMRSPRRRSRSLLSNQKVLAHNYHPALSYSRPTCRTPLHHHQVTHRCRARSVHTGVETHAHYNHRASQDMGASPAPIRTGAQRVPQRKNPIAPP